MRVFAWFWLCVGCVPCTYDPNAEPAEDLFGSSEVLVDRVWNVDPFRVHERVVLRPGFPDNTYERNYRVYDDGVFRELGRVHDEARTSIEGSASPIVIDGRLFVFVGATTLTWAPSTEPRRISPYDADGFDACGINGHYDVMAGSVSVEGDQWTIFYAPRHDGDSVQLRSFDAGETWRASCER